MTDELISASLCLAHLEGTRRSGTFNEADFKTIAERDVAPERLLGQETYSWGNWDFKGKAISAAQQNWSPLTDVHP